MKRVKYAYMIKARLTHRPISRTIIHAHASCFGGLGNPKWPGKNEASPYSPTLESNKPGRLYFQILGLLKRFVQKVKLLCSKSTKRSLNQPLIYAKLVPVFNWSPALVADSTTNVLNKAPVVFKCFQQYRSPTSCENLTHLQLLQIAACQEHVKS
jgi:hypothetical protein